LGALLRAKLDNNDAA